MPLTKNTTNTKSSAPTATRSFASRGRGGGRGGRGRGRGGRSRRPEVPQLTLEQKMAAFMNRQLWEIPGTKEYAKMANVCGEWVKQNPYSRMSEFYTKYGENDTPRSKTHFGLSLDRDMPESKPLTRAQKRNQRRSRMRCNRKIATSPEEDVTASE